MAETYLLGGRLPLLAPGDLSDGRQKELYQRMRTHQVPWADRHNFKGMTGDDKLIAPFNPFCAARKAGRDFWTSKRLRNGHRRWTTESGRW